MRIRPLAVTIALLMTSHTLYAQNLTTYATEWSGTNGYAFDGSHPSNYHDITAVNNPDMVDKAKHSNVLAYAFLQAWNQQLINSPTYNVPAAYLGMLHFSDLWASLPSNLQGDEYTAWHTICAKMSPGSCTTIQLNGVTKAQQFFDYNATDVGQMNNFGAFLKLPMPAGGKKIISIGGANLIGQNDDGTPSDDKTSVGARSFDAIFKNEAVFLTSLNNFLNAINSASPSVGTLDGIDYDFEPRIDDQHGGAQIPAFDAPGKPNAQVVSDYQNLAKLILDTRMKLPNAYISVTLTSNMDYLKAINSSTLNGWFAQIGPLVNSINIMTYDLHGPWGAGDPGALPHEMVTQDTTVAHNYAITYGVKEVIQQLQAFGVDPKKIQFGLATYGRGFAGVPQTTTASHPDLPGYDQPWTAASHFVDPDPKKTIKDGQFPYNEVNRLLTDPTSDYKNYEVKGPDGSINASYIYSAGAKQFVGYVSSHVLSTLCAYSKSQNLGGAIVWSMDSDASYDGSQGTSLIDQYAKECS